MTEHTQWTLSADKPWCIVDESGAVIATVSTNCAAMMVREHNAHGALVEALDALVERYDTLDGKPFENPPGSLWHIARAALSQARA